MATGVWRWRRNPLRRRTDLIEAWAALTTLVCLLVVAPAIGWLSGLSVDATLQRAAREQRQERHLVPAVVVRTVAGQPVPTQAQAQAQQRAPKPDQQQTQPQDRQQDRQQEQQQSRQSPLQGPQRTRVLAAWTAPDGSTHQGAVPAAEEPPRPGDRFRMWTDSGGRPVARPLDPSAAALHAGLAGLAAALAVAALVETVRRMVIRRLVHRRYQLLDRAWAAVGPDWGRAGAGS
ncbi:hypothetical protein [Streptomyces sp. NPDC048603]|uniref:Rv1733c family protein n=1 Tax=Streptomyces sp. NPDC048603 TaxID=3365577 RepID=UPI0037219FAC